MTAASETCCDTTSEEISAPKQCEQFFGEAAHTIADLEEKRLRHIQEETQRRLREIKEAKKKKIERELGWCGDVHAKMGIPKDYGGVVFVRRCWGRSHVNEGQLWVRFECPGDSFHIHATHGYYRGRVFTDDPPDVPYWMDWTNHEHVQLGNGLTGVQTHRRGQLSYRVVYTNHLYICPCCGKARIENAETDYEDLLDKHCRLFRGAWGHTEANSLHIVARVYSERKNVPAQQLRLCEPCKKAGVVKALYVPVMDLTRLDDDGWRHHVYSSSRKRLLGSGASRQQVLRWLETKLLAHGKKLPSRITQKTVKACVERHIRKHRHRRQLSTSEQAFFATLLGAARLSKAMGGNYAKQNIGK